MPIGNSDKIILLYYDFPFICGDVVDPIAGRILFSNYYLL